MSSLAGDQEESQRKQSTTRFSPRKNSFLTTTDHNKERLNMAHMVKEKIEQFVSEELNWYKNNNQQKPEVRESKVNVYEAVFNIVIISHIDNFDMVPNLQLYWDRPWGGMVTIRLVSTLIQFNFITTLLQEVTDLKQKKHLYASPGTTLMLGASDPGIDQGGRGFFPFEIAVVSVPKNYLRKIVGYQDKELQRYRSMWAVDFDYSRELLVDEVFLMNDVTQLRIFGKSQDVYAVNELIQTKISNIVTKTLLFHMNDCKLIMDNIKEVKTLADPCEIRVKRMLREWKDLRHPFYYLPNYLREVILIGSKEEVQLGDMKVTEFLRQMQGNESLGQGPSQQLSFLLPMTFKTVMPQIKQRILEKFNRPSPSPTSTPSSLQFFYYEPTYPRKHLTILLIGPWHMIVEAKQELEAQVNQMVDKINVSFENFQQYTYHQQIRFSFKSLKRFILEGDIKYLNHWDICSVFVENAGKYVNQNDNQSIIVDSSEVNNNPLYLDYYNPSTPNPSHHPNKDFDSLLSFLKQDPETCINSLFVLSKSEDSLESLMQRLQINKEDLIKMMLEILEWNVGELKKVYKAEKVESLLMNGMSKYVNKGGENVEMSNYEMLLELLQQFSAIKQQLHQLSSTSKSSLSYSFDKRLNSSRSSSRYSHRIKPPSSHLNPDNKSQQQSQQQSSFSRHETFHRRSRSRPSRRSCSQSKSRSYEKRKKRYRDEKYEDSSSSEGNLKLKKYQSQPLMQKKESSMMVGTDHQTTYNHHKEHRGRSSSHEKHSSSHSSSSSPSSSASRWHRSYHPSHHQYYKHSSHYPHSSHRSHYDHRKKHVHRPSRRYSSSPSSSSNYAKYKYEKRKHRKRSESSDYDSNSSDSDTKKFQDKYSNHPYFKHTSTRDLKKACKKLENSRTKIKGGFNTSLN